MPYDTIDAIVKQEMESIQFTADRQKDATKYIGELIKADFHKYANAFYPEKALPPRILAGMLFLQVKKTISALQEEYTQPAGVTRYSGKKENILMHPDVVLGWSEVVEFGTVGSGYIKNLTEKGRNVIDGYRSALGVSSLDARREELRRAQDKPVAAKA